MTELTDEEKVQIARQDFAFYIGWAHKTDMEEVSGGQAVPQPHHVQMIRRMEAVAAIILRLKKRQGQDRHTAIVAPPGSAKTTILQYYYEWMLGLASLYWGEGWADKWHSGHVSHSEAQAKRMSLAVMNTIDGTNIDSGPVFKLCFPKVKPSDKWSELEWRVEGCTGKDPTFACLGVLGGWPGFRWNLMGLDDLVNPDKVKDSTFTSTDIEKVIYRVEKIGMKRLVVGGCAVLTNTRWFERDPTSWALDQGWKHILIKALNEKDESFWEEREIFMSTELIAERERDPEGFALQFQGEPAPESGITFNIDWLSTTYDRVPWMENSESTASYLIVESWDTAGTKNARSDETAGWRAALDIRTWDIYLMNMWHDKLDMPELLNAITGSWDTLPHPSIVWIEDKSTGQPAAQMLRRTRIPVMPVKPYGERGQPRLQDVINQIKPMLSIGKVKFPSPEMSMNLNLTWVADARKALLMYPRGLHDDIPRSFIQLLYELLKLQQDMGIIDVQPQALGWGEDVKGERLVV